ncbi:MAG: hypothetical protein SOX50_00680 [Terrisporobacter othiniensis]|uniref:Large ribosomal subunit protein bL25 beta domain-containing protein n=1 Tax=Terrisporobacter muris TaxID=2963284 RepID=A0A9X2MBB5_9FIRM|nr:hypothetical protein [Terrisporobacter othiniensis]MCR1823013.1 hypothetical protein [Terrisporobacter muris]MDY3371788.1 hypothetical protein [Terrisporobacter othiniensis]
MKLKVLAVYTGQGLLESKGLLLEVIVSEVQLQGHPEDIPESIKIDVSELSYGDTISSQDLSIPITLKSDIDENAVVARVVLLSSSDSEEKSYEDQTSTN